MKRFIAIVFSLVTTGSGFAQVSDEPVQGSGKPTATTTRISSNRKDTLGCQRRDGRKDCMSSS